MAKAKVVDSKKDKINSMRLKVSEVEENLKTLKKRLQEEERKIRDANMKAVQDILRDHKLDDVPAESWLSVISQIKVLLGVDAEGETKQPAVKPDEPVSVE